jgi:hypothetical protein
MCDEILNMTGFLVWFLSCATLRVPDLCGTENTFFTFHSGLVSNLWKCTFHLKSNSGPVSTRDCPRAKRFFVCTKHVGLFFSIKIICQPMGVVHSCIFAPPICVRRCVRGIFPLVDRSSINEDRPLQADVDLVASWPSKSNTCYQRTTLSRYRVCCHDATHQATILRENGMISSTGECRHTDSSKVWHMSDWLDSTSMCLLYKSKWKI